jgi:hypothetical protein
MIHRGLGLGVLAVIAASSCMLSPGNGEVIDQVTDPVAFAGALTSPNGLVTLEAGPSRSGPFAGWSSASTRSTTTPVPAFSTTFYPWSLRAPIPSDRWSLFPLSATCQASHTFVRARTGNLTLVTFEAPAGLDALSCLANAGGSLAQSLNACTSPASPVVEVRAKNVFIGDVVLRTDADIAAHACDQVIRGSLSIPDSSLMLVSLPMLEEVTGNVAINLHPERRTTRDGYDVRQVQLPLLARIGRSLSYAQASVTGTLEGELVPLGLDRVEYVGGDVSIRLGLHGVSVTGLAGLSTLGGDLDLVFATPIADVGAGFLPNLRSVSGSVRAANGCSVIGLLDGLITVGGGLQLSNFSGCAGLRGFSAVQTVRGTVRLEQVGHVPALLQALTSAHGLVLDQSNLGVGVPVPYRVALQELVLQDSHTLGANWRLAPDARVRVTGSEVPAPADVCAYLLAQPDYRGAPPPELGGTTCAGLPR